MPRTCRTNRFLKAVAAEPKSLAAFLYVAQGNYFTTVPVTRLDLATRTLTLAPERGTLRLQGQAGRSQDRYQLVNHPSLIRKPGQWAFQKIDGRRTRVFFRPAAAGRSGADAIPPGSSTPPADRNSRPDRVARSRGGVGNLRFGSLRPADSRGRARRRDAVPDPQQRRQRRLFAAERPRRTDPQRDRGQRLRRGHRLGPGRPGRSQ